MRTSDLTRRRMLQLAAASSVGTLLSGRVLAQASPATVKIGLVAPLSGMFGFNGRLVRLGAEMAVDDINQAGGIRALGGAKLQLVIADAEDSPEKAKNAAQRLVADNPDLVAGVGAWLSTFTLAVTEVTERAQIPWFDTGYADQITGRGFKYVFQSSLTGGTLAKLAVPAIKAINASVMGSAPKTAALISDNTPGTQSFAKVIAETELPANGIQVVGNDVYTPPIADATSIISKLRRSKPDFLLLMAASPTDGRSLLEKMAELGMGQGRIPSIGIGGGIATPSFLKAVGAENLEGYIAMLANWPGKDNAALVEAFKKRTGEPWMTQDSISNYGHIWIIKEALETVGVADKVKVGQAVHAMNSTTGAAKFFMGDRLQFDANGRRVNPPTVVVQWQKGVPVPIYPREFATAKPMWQNK